MTSHPSDSQVEYLPPPPTVPPTHSYAGSYAGEPPNDFAGAANGPTWGVIGTQDADVIDAGRSTWQWRRVLPRTLTVRLVAGVVSLVVVLVLATGICTYVALRSFLYNRLDQQVSELADRTAPQIQRCFVQPGNCVISTPGSSGIQSPQRTWLAVLNPSGTILIPVERGNVLEPLTVSTDAGKSLVANPTHARTLSMGNASVRVTARSIANPVTTQTATVAVGLSTTEVDHTLSRLLKLELAIGIGAIVLALAATSYGVRYSLRRLRSVSTTAREVAAELSPAGAGLDRRVEVDEPETEVGQLAESMNTLLAAVETQFAERVASEERMRQFLADASHELRTPLTSIRGYAELSRMQGGGDQDNLSRIEAEGTRMSRLVDDLLTLARTDQGGERQREVVDVEDVLSDAVDGVRAAHPERRIDVSAEHGLVVRGDRDQLVRVVRNLATNAAVHTNPGGPISVRATHEGDEVVVRVSDTGPGLPPEEAAHVFERFWRADKSRTRARGGSGLGMSIVAALVQEHAGTVQFDSTVAGGSTVTVRLPRA